MRRFLLTAALLALGLPAQAAEPAPTAPVPPTPPAAAEPAPATPAPVAPVNPAEPAVALAEKPAAPKGPLPTEVVDSFHAALARGDRPAVLAQLASDLVIYEQGFVEQGRDAYAEGSLPNDATFAGMVRREVRSRDAWEDGNVAWVLTRTALSGDFGEPRKLELENTETIVLRRTDLGWKIVHIHRSAHPRGEEESRP